MKSDEHYKYDTLKTKVKSEYGVVFINSSIRKKISLENFTQY